METCYLEIIMYLKKLKKNLLQIYILLSANSNTILVIYYYYYFYLICYPFLYIKEAVPHIGQKFLFIFYFFITILPHSFTIFTILI